MHVCQLSSVISRRDMEILKEVTDANILEGYETLDLHKRDSPDVDSVGEAAVSEAAEKYIELITLQQEKLTVLERFIVLLERYV